MSRVRAAKGGNAGRVSMWVADDDPYLGPPNPSPLEKAEKFSIWEPVPFGQDARGNRVEHPDHVAVDVLRRPAAARQDVLPAAADSSRPAGRLRAALRRRRQGRPGLDAHEGTSRTAWSWAPRTTRSKHSRPCSRSCSRRWNAGSPCCGTCPRRSARRASSPRTSWSSTTCRSSSSPSTNCRSTSPPMDGEDREQVINDLCRIARRGPAAGFISNFASQRPDAESVPPKLREIITIRYSTQVIDRTISDMVLGKGKAAQGADASVLSEDHKGVGVLVTGPASFVTVRADLLDGRGVRRVVRQGPDPARAGRTAHRRRRRGRHRRRGRRWRHRAAPSSPTCWRSCGTPHACSPPTCSPRLVNLDEDTYGDFNGEQPRRRTRNRRRQAHQQASQDQRLERRRVPAPRHRSRRPRRDPPVHRQVKGSPATPPLTGAPSGRPAAHCREGARVEGGLYLGKGVGKGP